MHVNKYTVLTVILLICSISGLGIIVKYSYLDNISQNRIGTCEIQHCTYLGDYTCIYFREVQICYLTNVKFNLLNTNYTKSERITNIYNFTCDNSTVPCYYSISDINRTLSLLPPVSHAITGMLLLSFLIVILLALLYLSCYHSSNAFIVDDPIINPPEYI